MKIENNIAKYYYDSTKTNLNSPTLASFNQKLGMFYIDNSNEIWLKILGEENKTKLKGNKNKKLSTLGIILIVIISINLIGIIIIITIRRKRQKEKQRNNTVRGEGNEVVIQYNTDTLRRLKIINYSNK